MSDTTENLNPDDHAILLAMAQVTAGGIEVPLPATADRARVREYVEILGLLPYGLEPATPNAEAKARLLAAVGGQPAVAPPTAETPQRSFDEVTLDGSAGSRSGVPDPLDMTFRRVAPMSFEPAGTEPGWQEPAAAVSPWQEPEPQPLAAPQPIASEPLAAEPDRQPPIPSNVVPIAPAPAARPARGIGSWWTPALAAMLAFCMLGLAYLAAKVNQQNATITRLNSELQGLPIADLSAFHDEFSSLKRRFHMVTAVARHAYPMKTVQPLAPGAQTDGVVYVCGNHQRWYLNLQGLVPPPSGEEYNLWFVTGDRMISGGVIQVRADASSEMEAQTLPQGTHGFAVTREKVGTPHDQPAGTMVLLAEESIAL